MVRSEVSRQDEVRFATVDAMQATMRTTRTLQSKAAKRPTSRLQGQGEPVPAYLGSGAWVLENTIYLSAEYTPSPEQAIHDFPKVTPAGTLVLPISADAVAKHFGISVVRLLAANATGELSMLQRFDLLNIDGGGVLTLRFKFKAERLDIAVKSTFGQVGGA